jgi:hypothetical protein
MGGGGAGGLDDASFFGDVAVKDGQAAIGAKGLPRIGRTDPGFISISGRRRGPINHPQGLLGWP